MGSLLTLRWAARAGGSTAAKLTFAAAQITAPSCLGLSNTCPRVGVMRDAVSRDGQMSDNPKHNLPVMNDG
jgi:hypothetical protein